MPPEPFKNDKEFIRYCEMHSRTQRALFSIEQVEYLYRLAGEISPFESTSPKLFMSLPYDEPTTRELLDKASENVYRERRLSESIEDVSGKPDNNVVLLDDYR